MPKLQVVSPSFITVAVPLTVFSLDETDAEGVAPAAASCHSAACHCENGSVWSRESRRSEEVSSLESGVRRREDERGADEGQRGAASQLLIPLVSFPSLRKNLGILGDYGPDHVKDVQARQLNLGSPRLPHPHPSQSPQATGS
jgi:hypothetical protein